MKPIEIDTKFKIPEELLWDLVLPIEDVNISELSNNFDIPYLEHEDTDDWNMSISDLVDNFDNEPFHASQAMKADLKYPIELYYFRGNWIILDGVHRLTKAIKTGKTIIKVRRIPEKEIRRIISENSNKIRLY